MTIAEILKAAGLDDTVIQTIQESMKTNKIFTASEENLDLRYGKLKEQIDGKDKQIKEFQDLVETLQKETKGQEALQKTITDAQARMAQLEKENQELRADSGMDRMLIAAGAKQSDLDYLKFQWRKKGDITFDDNGEIKGGEDAVAGLKVQCPAQFEGGGGRKYEERPLPKGDDSRQTEPQSLEDALRQQYEDKTS